MDAGSRDTPLRPNKLTALRQCRTSQQNGAGDAGKNSPRHSERHSCSPHSESYVAGDGETLYERSPTRVPANYALYGDAVGARTRALPLRRSLKYKNGGAADVAPPWFLTVD